MTTKYKFPFFLLSALALALIAVVFIFRDDIAVLGPKGIIAFKERHLILVATILMLIVVIPVLVMAPYFAWKYHESNTKAKYSPDWDNSLIAELVWWGFPLLIVIFLSILTWQSSHELDPYKPLESETKPLRIQVVALQWKWLFIYPEHNIATLNHFQFPVNTPLNFEITADAPMNSFWIPQLGGQMYAMPGMTARLHLMADQKGTFRGSSANLSGVGFAGMHFESQATDEQEFEEWVKTVSQSESLDRSVYEKLAKPSENVPPTSFALKDKGLFEEIVMKYMPKRKE